MNTKTLKLRFKKYPEPTGLASIGAGPRGYDLIANLPNGEKEDIASISPVRNGWKFEWLGWGWAVATCKEIGVKHFNCPKVYPLIDEGLAQAKADCLAYVKKQIEAFEG